MTSLEQLSQSTSQSASTFDDFFLATGDMRTGQLGNVYAQAVYTFNYDSVIETYGKLLSVPNFFKLAMLKRRRFTLGGRQERIEKSLAALNAPEPTDLMPTSLFTA
jgi:hypothetical protein